MDSIDIRNTFILASAFLVLFAVAEILYHKFNVKAELTRKFVHVVTGLLTLLFPLMLNNHWLVLLLCSSFAVILIISLRFNLLKSINAIDRESVGSIAYPVSVLVCYLAFEYRGYDYNYYYLPVLILAICDPVAALTGKRWPLGKFRIGSGYKTIMGSSMFLLSAFILAVILEQPILVAIIIAISSTITEAVSARGWDNITIPLGVLIVLFLV